MQPLTANQIGAFRKQFDLRRGRLRAARIRHGSEGAVVEVRLTVREAVQNLGDRPRTVKLRLRISGVDEYRFQKRPSITAGSPREIQVAYLSGLIFLNLDAYRMEPGEQPAVHDFRASDAYVAGRTCEYEVIPIER